MTLRNGAVELGVIDKFAGGTETRINLGHGGAVQLLGFSLGNTATIYKNFGYYATGAVFESWITSGLPSSSTTNPVTGHALSNVQYFELA